MNLEGKRESLELLGVFFKNCVLQYNNEFAKTENTVLNSLQTEAVNLFDRAQHENGWFTKDSVIAAFSAWSNSLSSEKIDKWLNDYNFGTDNPKKVGVIMAGNIPMVGLHDSLCVLLSGHFLKAKLSSKDKSLMLLVLNAIKQIDIEWANQIEIAENLKDIDILIATGSDNSSRYFDYYFKDKKRLIRSNRTSVAILDGKESKQDYENLAHDIFTHFGLGCRNVTKIYVPVGFDLDLVFGGLFQYKEIGNNNKYANNYDYNKAIYMLNKIELIENGFILFKEDTGLHSPVGVLFYEYYDSLSNIKATLKNHKDSIQCKVTALDFENKIPFGKAQSPELWDYADGVDTLKFLMEA